jgi:hypothetical protein
VHSIATGAADSYSVRLVNPHSETVRGGSPHHINRDSSVAIPSGCHLFLQFAALTPWQSSIRHEYWALLNAPVAGSDSAILGEWKHKSCHCFGANDQILMVQVGWLWPRQAANACGLVSSANTSRWARLG